MDPNSQETVALALVAAAAAYLIWLVWRVLVKKQRTGCGGCAKCPSDVTPEGAPLVSIDVKKPTRPSSP